MILRVHKKGAGTLGTIDFQLPLPFGDPEPGFAVGAVHDRIVHQTVNLVYIQPDDHIFSNDKSRHAPEPSGRKFGLGFWVPVDIFGDK